MISSEKILSAVDAYYKKIVSDRAFLEQNAEETLENDDKYYKAKYRVRDLKIRLERARFVGNDTEIYNLTKLLDSAEKEFKAIKNDLSPSTNDLPSYSCEKCKDTGYRDGDYCECYYKELNSVAYDHLGIKDIADKSFKDDNLSALPQLNGVYSLMQKFLSKFPETDKNILLTGEKGTGKTFLTECVVNALNDKKLNALFLSAFDLNNLFVKNFSLPYAERITTEEILTTCDLLAIDDLGAEPLYNKVTIENLTAIISERLALKKPFIITTNLALDEISDRYGERLFSRLCGNRTVILKIDGKDLRFI